MSDARAGINVERENSNSEFTRGEVSGKIQHSLGYCAIIRCTCHCFTRGIFNIVYG